MNYLSKHKQVLIYGLSLAALMFVLRWLQLRLLVFNYTIEVYIGSIAVIFTALGIWLALKLTRPKVKTVVVEKEVHIHHTGPFRRNEKEAEKLGLSNREQEVLELMSQGLTNQEIASRLYVSLNTVKTHSSNLFRKLEVERRTQAIGKAKKLGIIA